MESCLLTELQNVQKKSSKIDPDLQKSINDLKVKIALKNECDNELENLEDALENLKEKYQDGMLDENPEELKQKLQAVRAEKKILAGIVREEKKAAEQGALLEQSFGKEMAANVRRK